jgi:hypothetical protein
LDFLIYLFSFVAVAVTGQDKPAMAAKPRKSGHVADFNGERY